MQHPFPYGWLIAYQKWAPVEDTFLRNPHGAPVDAKWNKVCMLPLRRRQGGRVDDAPGTEVAELGISCEACHGPAREHIAHFRQPQYAGRPKE